MLGSRAERAAIFSPSALWRVSSAIFRHSLFSSASLRLSSKVTRSVSSRSRSASSWACSASSWACSAPLSPQNNSHPNIILQYIKSLFYRLVNANAIENGIQNGNKNQRDEGPHNQSPNNGHRHGTVHRIRYQGQHTQNGGQRSHNDRAHPQNGGRQQALVTRGTVSQLNLYLIEQHNRIFYQHAGQTQHPDDGDKGEGLSGQQQTRNNADDRHGQTKEYDQGAAVVVEQQEQHQHDDAKGQGNVT